MTGAALTLLGLLFGTLATSLWVGLALFGVAIAGLTLFRSLPVDKVLAQNVWNTVTTPELLSLPLFILMAEILFRTRLSDQLLRGLTPWAVLLPGRLAHINVLACTLFATVSGSSAATTATVGRITLSELLGRGYDRALVTGSLAGAGTLGFLIPPSIVMIIYAALAEVSLLRLFLAGIVPGLLMAAGFMGYIALRAAWRPDLMPEEQTRFTWGERLRALRHLAPVVALMVTVLGSMYGGIASPTEAAAMGVLGALAVSAASGTLGRASLVVAFQGAARTSSMIGLIVAGAGFLALAMGYLGIPRAVAAGIGALELSPLQLIAMLVVFYVLLGFVLEGLGLVGPHAADHLAADHASGVRPHLVRRLRGHHHRDGPNHAARRLQPFRHPGHHRPADRTHRTRCFTILADHGGDRLPPGRGARPRAVVAGPSILPLKP